MRSFGSILDANKGVGPGFPFLRLFLAMLVFSLHALTVTNQYYFPGNEWPWFIHDSIVPMFFALGGFLVAASAYRLSPNAFALSRALRIVPALAVDTVVCALVIGPIFTTVPLATYFGSAEFREFFLNIAGLIHYTLPGVFEKLPMARVNGSLWSIPFELIGYGILFCIMSIGLYKRKAAVLLLFLSYMIAAVAVRMTNLPDQIHSAGLRKLIQIAFLDHEAEALNAYFIGIVAYQYRFKIPHSLYIFLGCAAVCAVIMFTCTRGEAQPMLRFIWLPALVYLTVFIGLTPMPLPKALTRGDYSYGIYLYHQPFMQGVITLFPAVAFAAPWGAPFVFALALPFVLTVAFVSWHLIEKPALALRNKRPNRTALKTPTRPSSDALTPSAGAKRRVGLLIAPRL